MIAMRGLRELALPLMAAARVSPAAITGEWAFPLAFPANFTAGPDVTPMPAATLESVYKQHLPIVTKNG